MRVTNLALDQKYHEISQTGKAAASQQEVYVDHFLNDLPSDNRIGLTALIPIKGEVLESIKTVLSELSHIDPFQYYYPLTDLHVTVLDFIGATESLKVNPKQIKLYKEMLHNVLLDQKSFKIDLKGIVMSKGAVIAKGYYEHSLESIRNGLRYEATKKGLLLKERYEVVTAHVTMARFRSSLINPAQFVSTIEKFENKSLGTIEVDKIDFVLHDWYNLKYKTQLLQRYPLQKII
ncbi:2'-5' RNA ligase family protein [Sediminitomix flava]|uniref:2'-5' RNA ligase n=1 Tax=Sediminitomix flava TaxID=379075 RepID=A0A315ZG82_SEDFL|nr:hypothetical protein [Sediminitomix flava]PWJ44521.1 2'-5' RNA ligase [Sediminitomix flava]